MKKFLLGVAAVALTATTALAADLPSRKGPPPAYLPPPPVFSWTGLYAGVNIGGGWLERYNTAGWGTAWSGLGWPVIATFDLPSPGGGVVGGGQVGYNWQLTPMFVVGVETDIQGTSMGGRGGGNNFWSLPTRSVDWFGTVRGRIGVTALSPQLLIYGTGGFAYGDLRLHNGWFGAMRETATGWTAGGGAEYALTPSVSAKAEYLYNNIGATYPGVPAAEHRVRMHTIRAGLNYKFNWGQLAPVMAGY